MSSRPSALLIVVMAMTLVGCVSGDAREDAGDVGATLTPDAVLGADVDARETSDALARRAFGPRWIHVP
jgi:hypothetical protein